MAEIDIDNYTLRDNGDGTFDIVNTSNGNKVTVSGDSLDAGSISTDEATLNDTATSPSAAGKFRLNGTDIEAYSGGGVKNLSDIGSGGGGSANVRYVSDYANSGTGAWSDPYPTQALVDTIGTLDTTNPRIVVVDGWTLIDSTVDWSKGAHEIQEGNLLGLCPIIGTGHSTAGLKLASDADINFFKIDPAANGLSNNINGHEMRDLLVYGGQYNVSAGNFVNAINGNGSAITRFTLRDMMFREMPGDITTGDAMPKSFFENIIWDYATGQLTINHSEAWIKGLLTKGGASTNPTPQITASNVQMSMYRSVYMDNEGLVITGDVTGENIILNNSNDSDGSASSLRIDGTADLSGVQFDEDNISSELVLFDTNATNSSVEGTVLNNAGGASEFTNNGGLNTYNGRLVSGSVTLSSGSATVDTGISTSTTTTFGLFLAPDTTDADVAGDIRADSGTGTYVIDIEETDTSVGNPTVNYDVQLGR